MIKRIVFKYYILVALGFVALAITYSIRFAPSNLESLIPTILGGALAFVYFVQRQKLEELRLFKDLFTDFNRRYDDLNEILEDIRAAEQLTDPKGKKKLVDYFNLCAEEYLFYQEGYIHPNAWRSWCHGMLYYFESRCIREVWEEEVKSDSYYCLTLEKIREGADQGGCR